MGGLVGGGKPDTSAAEAQLAAQREETARARKAAEEEKRDLQMRQASQAKARRMGGKRSLLASRVAPETGMDDEDNLGTQA